MSVTAVCTKCRVEKPVEDFYFKPWGNKMRRAACKECERISVKERSERRKAERIRATLDELTRTLIAAGVYDRIDPATSMPDLPAPAKEDEP